MSALGVLVVPALTSALALAQGAPLAPELERRHRETVRAERTARFFELWPAASAERRAAAERALSVLRPPGSPLDSRPSLETLALATRVLAGAELDEARADLLGRFVDALDVRFVPGAARAGIERGEPVTAWVRGLYRTSLEGDLDLALIWVDGLGRETLARCEPFRARDFEAGFTMHLRAPSAEPGAWRLVPEVTLAPREGRVAQVARGAPLPFEVVPRLEERLAALPAGGDPLDVLRNHGIRPADGRAAAAWLAALETDRGRAEPPGGPGGRTLLVVAPFDEAADALFREPIGAAWRALVEERGLRVVTIGAREALDAGLVETIAALGPRVVLVARADAVTAVHLALAGARVDLEGLVLCSTLPRPGPALPAVPTLLVGPGDGREPGDPPGLERARGGASALLSEPLLPGLLGEWLDRLSGRAR